MELQEGTGVLGMLLVVGNKYQRFHRGFGGWKDGASRVQKALGSKQERQMAWEQP